MKPRPEQPPPDLPEASPLWPLVVLLGEIAIRVEHEQVAKKAADSGTARLSDNVA